MKFNKKFSLWMAGIAAGTVNGLLGAGGGMVLVPLLSRSDSLLEEEVFPASVSIILPICLVSLWLGGEQIPWANAVPYLIGSGLGGILAGILGKRIPTRWLHRGLGLLILYGGVRYLC